MKINTQDHFERGAIKLHEKNAQHVHTCVHLLCVCVCVCVCVVAMNFDTKHVYGNCKLKVLSLEIRAQL